MTTDVRDIQEIERRFLVYDFDRASFQGDLDASQGHSQILQGYLLTAEGESSRIRITDNHRAEGTKKTGIGRSRREVTLKLDDAQQAYKILDFFCHDRLAKKRVIRDGFEVDFYEGPLAGLVIAEKELASEDEPVVMPSWVTRWIEVTDSLTNQQIARLATELQRRDEPLRHEDLLAPRMPMFVLTGPPGSGKSTLIDELRQDVVIGTAAHFVPEVATILISQVGIRPDPSDPRRFSNFQQTLYRVQRSFEELARFQALADGKKVVILDRGSMDAAAYLPRGTLTLEQLCNTTSAAEYARYKAVAILEPAPAEVYAAMKSNNAARRENYDEVLELTRGIQEAWDGHPLRRRIGLRAKSWEDKRKDAIDFLLSTIEF